MARYFSLEARVVGGDALGILKIQTEACRLKFGVTQRRCYEATARLDHEERRGGEAQGRVTSRSTAASTSFLKAYSTMSFLRPWTNATTSRCSASGTWNFASVAAA